MVMCTNRWMHNKDTADVIPLYCTFGIQNGKYRVFILSYQHRLSLAWLPQSACGRDTHRLRFKRQMSIREITNDTGQKKNVPAKWLLCDANLFLSMKLKHRQLIPPKMSRLFKMRQDKHSLPHDGHETVSTECRMQWEHEQCIEGRERELL